MFKNIVFDYTNYRTDPDTKDNPTEEWFEFLEENNARRLRVSQILDNLVYCP